MKVLVVSEPGENGVFTYVESLCHHLISHGIEVHMAYSSRRGGDRLDRLVRRIGEAGGRTVDMGVASNVTLADFGAFWLLWRLAWSVRPDVVHCHSSKAGALGRMLALSGIRASYFYHPHAYYGMRPARRASDGVYDAAESFFGRIGSTIVVSRDEWRYAEGRLRLPASRLRLIPNGIVLERFHDVPRPEKLALREALGVPRDHVLLGALGRLSPQKDPRTLYLAFAEASKGRDDLHLLHVGSGELEAEMDALIGRAGIRRRVTRLAYMSDPAGFYRAVDGFILTSTYEGLSLASLEAVSANLPLILSRAPGNNDLLDLPLSHVWGAEPGNAGQFSECIGRWYASVAEGRRPNHRALAMERYDSRRTLAAVVDLYRGAIDSARRAREAWAMRLPVLFWLAVIGFESSDRFSQARTRRFLYPFFHALTGVGYDDFASWNHALRKAGHVFGYGALCALAYREAGYELRRRGIVPWPVRCAAAALSCTALVASLDEWHQTMIPSRTGTLADVVLDTAAGVAVLALILWRARRAAAAPPDTGGMEGRPQGGPGDPAARRCGSRSRSRGKSYLRALR